MELSKDRIFSWNFVIFAAKIWTHKLLFILWRRGVVVNTTAQFHSTKLELRFCVGSNPVHGVSEIHYGEDLWQWSWLERRLNTFRRSTIQFKNFYVPFVTMQSIGFTFFTKITKGSCIFCCSSCISFNPTSHLNLLKLKLVSCVVINKIALETSIFYFLYFNFFSRRFYFMHVITDFLIHYLRIQKQPSKGQLLHWCFSRGLFGSYAIYYLFGHSWEF